ncbi:DUF2332 domain-containing protein [Sphingomonas panacisoli]|uniref:DUF2332 domain-containing protein n=1 Tax=Sphingomonas panacisoli TaxID=1813879 RepID=A0A5B8LFF8_9SPHN|nr:DUF2332 domain-containing protein [Sphingomonas panacisoli]QDZ06454.1 DUF2332 domain-containing protein [Sphingomonas panacisoli]
MAGEENNRGAFRIQEFYCTKNGAPIYARLCAAIAEGLTRESRIGARVLDWPGEPTRDALPLRFIGGLHALVRAGRDAGLAAIFAGETTDPATVATDLNRALVAHDDDLLPWLDGPPQTNEPGRSGSLMTGLLEVARRFGPKIELLEIGSSAGLNLLIDRYAFDLGGTRVGPTDSTVTLTPEWKGPAPEPAPVDIVSVRGCDIQPLDATDPVVATRLLAYVWPEMPVRFGRMERAIAMQREKPVDLVQADAADWVEARLAEPQAAGVTRVLMHSVVWQYLPEASADRVRAAMKAAGAQATAERPLAWVMVEPNRAFAEHVIRVRSRPGDGEWQILATAHAHGAWIKYGEAADADRVRIDLPEAAKVDVS